MALFKPALFKPFRLKGRLNPAGHTPVVPSGLQSAGWNQSTGSRPWLYPAATPWLKRRLVNEWQEIWGHDIWGHPLVGFVVADVGKLRSQFFDRDSLQCSNLVCHVECHVFAPMSSPLWTLNRADHCARFAGEHQVDWPRGPESSAR